ncbi:MAG: acyl carrier protein [Oscillospiraceae bacterium]|jgi:acyl carrier protein|nr:acyl carrier protein [Oscillospiraceae bacterium]
MVFEKIRKALATQFERDIDDITENTDIALDLGADSLDLVELITELESEYNITVTDESIYTCKTVGELTEYVEGLLG